MRQRDLVHYRARVHSTQVITDISAITLFFGLEFGFALSFMYPGTDFIHNIVFVCIARSLTIRPSNSTDRTNTNRRFVARDGTAIISYPCRVQLNSGGASRSQEPSDNSSSTGLRAGVSRRHGVALPKYYTHSCNRVNTKETRPTDRRRRKRP